MVRGQRFRRGLSGRVARRADRAGGSLVAGRWIRQPFRRPSASPSAPAALAASPSDQFPSSDETPRRASRPRPERSRRGGAANAAPARSPRVASRRAGRRAGPLFARAAASLLVALAAGLWVQGAANAQTPITLVSNTGETAQQSASNTFQAQSFTTGSNAGGYTVSEVQIRLSAVATATTSVKFRENNSSNQPGDLVATLTNPASFSTTASLHTFTAPTDTTLAANTTYWITVNEGIATRATYSRTTSDNETGQTGWSIGDNRFWRSAESSVWSSSTTPLMLLIKGTLVGGTNSAPTFDDGASTTRSVAENTAAGEAVGAPVAASDTDTGDTLTYMLEGTDAASFAIDSDTGQIRTKAALDYETKTSYAVTVRVSDGTDEATIDVTINVTDVTETPPAVPTPDTPPGAETLWTATLTVEADTSFDDAGYYFFANEGDLTSTSFTYDSKSFEIHYFGTRASSSCAGSGVNSLSIWESSTTSDWSNAESSWLLYIGSHAFGFEDADEIGVGEVLWCGTTASDLGWSDGYRVDVKIVKRNPPDAPTNLDGTPGDGQVALSWTAPAKNGGSAITKHQYRQSPDGGTNWGAWTDIPMSAAEEANATGYTVTGLTNGSTYTFQVRAVNAAGEGTESDSVTKMLETMVATCTPAPPAVGENADGSNTIWSACMTVGTSTDGSPPGSVSSVYGYTSASDPVVGSISNNSISYQGTDYTVNFVRWLVVTLGDSTITDVLSFKPLFPAASDDNLILELDGTQFPIAGFVRQSDAYALNNHGISWTDGQAVAVSLRELTAPDAPTDLAGTPGDGEVALSWTAPAKNGGGTIAKHQYRQREGLGSYGEWTDIANSAAEEANATAYTVTGLTNGVGHRFEVRAVNAGGRERRVGRAGHAAGASPVRRPERDHDADLVGGPDSRGHGLGACGGFQPVSGSGGRHAFRYVHRVQGKDIRHIGFLADPRGHSAICNKRVDAAV